MTITVCWKWVSVDDGHDSADARWAGVSPADEAALELALELRDAHGDVTVVSVGPAGADAALRDALAAGATKAVRIDAGPAHESRDVAVAIAAVATASDFVICGDYSLDRGTGSVPAFLAHELGTAQALGLVEVDTATIEGGRLRRRAPLAAALRSKSAHIDVVSTLVGDHNAPALVMPFRPRARTLAAPAGPVLNRVREILDIGGTDVGAAETVELRPPDAAARIVDQLQRWGYLDDGDADDRAIGHHAPG